MSAEQIAELIRGFAFLPAARWDELSADHVPFDQLTGGDQVEAPLAREVRRDHSAMVVGGGGAGKSSVIAHVTEALRTEGFVPLRVGVIAAERDAILDPARFARHAVQEVLASQQAQIESWQRSGLIEATAEEVSVVTGGSGLEAGAGVGIPPAQLNVTGRLRTGTQQLLRSFDSSRAVDALRQIVGIVNYRDDPEEELQQPVFIVEDTDAWLGTPFDNELVEAFFQRDLRMLVNEVPAPTLVAVHPDYRDTDGFQAIRDRLGQVAIPVFDDPRPPLSAILEHRIARAGVQADVDELFDHDALVALASVYSESGGNLRATLLAVHYALEERPGAETVTADDIRYARQAHVP